MSAVFTSWLELWPQSLTVEHVPIMHSPLTSLLHNYHISPLMLWNRLSFPIVLSVVCVSVWRLCIVAKQCKIGILSVFTSNRNMQMTFRLVIFSTPWDLCLYRGLGLVFTSMPKPQRWGRNLGVGIMWHWNSGQTAADRAVLGVCFRLVPIPSP